MTCYRYYLQLDEDRNGLLSKAELLQFGRPQLGFPIPVPACALTAVFIDRVFEECCKTRDYCCGSGYSSKSASNNRANRPAV